MNTLPLQALLCQTYAISLGYMGKIESENFTYLFNKSRESYKNLDLMSDLLQLEIQFIDIESLYVTDQNFDDIINDCKKLYKQFSDEEKTEIDFRYSLLNLMQYLKFGDQKNLNESELKIKDFIQNHTSSNYKLYWAQCVYYLICKKNRKQVTSSLLNNRPDGAISKASTFPLILFVMVRAQTYARRFKENKRTLFNVERRLVRLLNEFPKDVKYQEFIVNNFGLVLEQWLTNLYEDKHSTVQEKFYHMIHVNELLQSRLLLRKKFIRNIEPDGINKSRKNIELLDLEARGSGLIYISINTRNSFDRDVRYVLVLNKSEESSIKIFELYEDDLERIKTKFSLKIFTNSSKEDQDEILDKYGKVLSKLNEELTEDKYLVVPNGLFLFLPIHMARIENKYWYEKINFNYLPSLIYQEKTKELKTDLGIYFSKDFKSSKKEAEMIGNIVKAKLYSDPGIDQIEKTMHKHNAIHIVTHQKNGKIKFKDGEILLDNFIDLIPKNLKFIICNFCSSFNIDDLNGKYPINNKSISQKLIAKNIKKVITHNWELGQDASRVFSESFYKNNSIMENFKQFRPSEYGGYMDWGKVQ